MKQTKIIALTSLCIAALSATMATQAAVPLPLGWYAEGNVGEPNISNITYATNSSNSTTGIGWNLSAGYKFMPFFALEGGYTTYATTNAKFNGTTVAKGTSQSFDLVGKAILPIQNSGFEFIAKLGVGRTKTHVTNSDNSFAVANGIAVNAGTFNSTSLVYGVGGEYAFTPEMLVNAQWVRSDGGSGTGDLDLYSIGVAYMFG